MQLQPIFKRTKNNSEQGKRPLPPYLIATAIKDKESALDAEIKQLSTRTRRDFRLLVFFIIVLTMSMGAEYLFLSAGFSGIAVVTYQGLGITLQSIALALIINNQLTQGQERRQHRKDLLTLLVRLKIVYERLSSIEHEAGNNGTTGPNQNKEALLEKAGALEQEIEDLREVNRRVQEYLSIR